MSSGSGSSFDASEVSRPTWIAGAGALVLLISVFFSWYKVSAGGLSSTVSGWSSTDLAKLVALLALVALVLIGIELFADDVTLPFPTSLALIAIGGLSTLIVLLRMVDKPDGGGAAAAAFGGLDVGLSFGIFLSLIAAVAVAVGGYLKMQEPA